MELYHNLIIRVSLYIYYINKLDFILFIKRFLANETNKNYCKKVYFCYERFFTDSSCSKCLRELRIFHRVVAEAKRIN